MSDLERDTRSEEHRKIYNEGLHRVLFWIRTEEKHAYYRVKAYDEGYKKLCGVTTSKLMYEECKKEMPGLRRAMSLIVRQMYNEEVDGKWLRGGEYLDPSKEGACYVERYNE